MTETGPSGLGLNGLHAAARVLRIDALVGAVTHELAAQGHDAVLLKGSTLDFLYGPGKVRQYVDADLLVSPEASATVAEILMRLGYRELLRGAAASERAAHADTWVKEGAPAIDVHRTLVGIGASPGDVWRVLSGHTVGHSLGGDVVVKALDLPGRALHLALHAAQEGPAPPKTVPDLVRGLEVIPFEVWRAAADLARELYALPAFVSGITLHEDGAALAAQLGLSSSLTLTLGLRRTSAPSPTKSVARLLETPGWTARARLVGRSLVPTPASIRLTSRLAQRGGLGLVLAYAARPFKVVARLPVALRTVRQVRRGSD